MKKLSVNEVKVKQLTKFGSELHPLLFVHVVQDGVFGFLPHLGLSPPKHTVCSDILNITTSSRLVK